MQPYFLPYIGYFQLIAGVDQFIVYDNIKYTKKGWINRNRLLLEGKDAMFSLPIKSGSDSLNVCERQLSDSLNREKLFNQFSSAYRRAPYFNETYPLVKRIVEFDEVNLFGFLKHSIESICKHLAIQTKIVVSSSVDIDHGLKGAEKVMALCESLGAHTYVNSFGGKDLYSKEQFLHRGLELLFLQPKPIVYPQFGNTFVPWLSIVDVLMFNGSDIARSLICRDYTLS